MGIIVHYIIPSLYIQGAFIIETHKKVRGAPTKAVAKAKRGDLPYAHFRAAVRAYRFFFGKNLF
jgi:hypothetical protein